MVVKGILCAWYRLRAKAMELFLIASSHQMGSILPAQTLMDICYYLVLDAINIMKRWVE